MADKDLLNEFQTFGVEVADIVLRKCVELLQRHSVSPETFVENWIAFSTMKFHGDAPDLTMLEQFERESLSKESNQKSIKKETNDDELIIHNHATISESFEDDDLLGSYGTPVRKTSTGKRLTDFKSTPQSKRIPGFQSNSFSPSTSSPGTPSTSTCKFSARNNAGEIVAKFPSNIEAINWVRNNTRWQPDIQFYCEEYSLKSTYKYMFERLKDKNDVFDDCIYRLQDVIAKKYDIEEWSHNRTPNAENIRVVGRVCCDASNGARLNSSSLLLEGSTEICSGQSVPFRVDHVKEYSFFPGQIIAMEGSNPTGQCINVQRIFYPPSNPIPKTEIEFDGPMNVLMACGPFTLTEDLDFAPLEALVQQIHQMKPHVIILLGPFLDAKNRKVESGELGRTYEEEFEDLVEKLATHIDSSVQVILVPSWRDCHHHPVYPTCPYKFKRNIPNIRSVSDPCILNISGCVIALTSTDVLFHLGKEEIAVAPAGSDRLARLSSHLLNQQCFYPLYPPAEEMSIDFEHWYTYCRLPLTPHLLVLPSDLRYFIKNIEGCVVINPERLAKGTSGGTFSRLQIKNEENPISIEAEIVRI